MGTEVLWHAAQSLPQLSITHLGGVKVFVRSKIFTIRPIILIKIACEKNNKIRFIRRALCEA